MAPTLTFQQAKEMQEALIAEYSRPEFQGKLLAAFQEAGSDLLKFGRARQELCLPVQGPIIAKYGFEPSRKGVAMSVAAFTPQMNADPEIAAGNAHLAVLVNPALRGERDAKHDAEKPQVAPKADPPKADAPKAEVPKEQPLPEQALQPGGEPGKRWTVVGGASHGGIVARRGKDLASPVLTSGDGQQARLATGAVVEQLELSGERLHYQKLSGEGPDFGWVSLSLKGVHLLERLDADEEDA